MKGNGTDISWGGDRTHLAAARLCSAPDKYRVEPAGQALPSQRGIDPDEVDIGFIVIVRSVEADEESFDPLIVLQYQTGTGKELQKELRKQQRKFASLIRCARVTPPPLHALDDHTMIGDTRLTQSEQGVHSVLPFFSPAGRNDRCGAAEADRAKPAPQAACHNVPTIPRRAARNREVHQRGSRVPGHGKSIPNGATRPAITTGRSVGATTRMPMVEASTPGRTSPAGPCLSMADRGYDHDETAAWYSRATSSNTVISPPVCSSTAQCPPTDRVGTPRPRRCPPARTSLRETARQREGGGPSRRGLQGAGARLCVECLTWPALQPAEGARASPAPEQVVRHTARAGHDLQVEPVEQLIGGLPEP